MPGDLHYATMQNWPPSSTTFVLAASLATMWRHLHWLQILSSVAANQIGCKFKKWMNIDKS